MYLKEFAHQVKIRELMEQNNSYAIFAEQGCGKTLPTLIHLSNLFIEGKIRNALIVAPLSAVGAWTRDLDKLSVFRANLIMKNTTIINYDLVWRREEFNREWDCVILDEAHSIACRGKVSKRAKFFIGDYSYGKLRSVGLNRKSKYRYILTGTPISNGKLEMYYNLMDFLDPNCLGNYNQFQNRFCKMKNLRGTPLQIISGYKDENVLLDYVATKSFRIEKINCLDLPEKLEDEVIECELMEKQMYKEALKNTIEEFDMNIPNPLSRLVKLRQLVSGSVIDEFGDVHLVKTSKISRLNELLDSIGERKVVIYANFKQSIKLIKECIEERGGTYYILDGEQEDKQIWKRYQENNTQYMICQYQSANSGIDLFASSHMILFEPNLSTTIIEQTKDRIHRIGQKTACSYYWLITPNTIEEEIYKRLRDKQDFNTECMTYIRDKYSKEKQKNVK